LDLRSGRRRPGIAGILIAAMLFAMIFTAGVGYLLFQAQSDKTSYSANIQAQRDRQLASQEEISLCVESGLTNPCTSGQVGAPGLLTVVVNDTGGFPVSVVGWFVRDSAGTIVSPGVVSLNSTLNPPVNLDVGNYGSVPLTGYTYSGGTISVSLVTSRGNTFTAQYPLSTTVTTTQTFPVTVTTTGSGSGGGNSLVVMMAATPLQVFSGNTITDNVTLFNYSNEPMTDPTLIPKIPTSTTTGTALLSPGTCTKPSSETIAAYTGGAPPHVSFLCTYTASSGQVGGLASFSGSASVEQGNNTIYSSGTTSNLVQIGGLTNPLAQGAFTSNFFFFKYSSCVQASGANFAAPCTTNYAPPPNVEIFPEADLIKAGSNYYVAFYLNITNNFNSPLPILSYTFVQFESNENESDWWIVGTNKSMTAGTYYPTYNPVSGNPTLLSYPADCSTVNAKNVPTDSNCLYVDPGKTVTITLAACGPGVSTWDWGGWKYGIHFGAPPAESVAGCTSSTPYLDDGGASSGSATAAIIVISFEYNGAVYTQDIAFSGVAFLG
jgi:hypothetical protein